MRDTPRTASVISTSRCVLLTITKENFNKFFEDAPEAISDFEIRLLRDKCEIRSILYHPTGSIAFQKHLAGEFSEENFLFWKACRQFRALGRQGKEKNTPEAELLSILTEKAKSIKENFIGNGAPQEVNLKADIRDEILLRIEVNYLSLTTLLPCLLPFPPSCSAVAFFCLPVGNTWKLY